MALVATIQGPDKAPVVVGSVRMGTFNLAFDSSYPTGGEPFTPSMFGMARIDFLLVNPTAGYVFETDYTNSKVLAYRQKDPANAGGADIALPEVGNTISLAAVTAARAFVIGV